MYGPPGKILDQAARIYADSMSFLGNGKTISIKVIMKTCTERGFTPLYVRSFQSE